MTDPLRSRARAGSKPRAPQRSRLRGSDHRSRSCGARRGSASSEHRRREDQVAVGGARLSNVSGRAIRPGTRQVGRLGSGNGSIEVDPPNRARSDPDPELAELALDPHASPRGVLAAETRNETDDLGIERGAPGPMPRVGPLPPHELAVPPEERLGRDHERGPPVPGERPARRREERPIAVLHSGRRTVRRRTFTRWRRTAFSSWSWDMLPRPVNTPIARTSTK